MWGVCGCEEMVTFPVTPFAVILERITSADFRPKCGLTMWHNLQGKQTLVRANSIRKLVQHAQKALLNYCSAIIQNAKEKFCCTAASARLDLQPSTST